MQRYNNYARHRALACANFIIILKKYVSNFFKVKKGNFFRHFTRSKGIPHMCYFNINDMR